jgi:Tubulin binding cofactor C
MSQIPEEYIFKDRKGETLTKMPRSINEQVFNAQRLENCIVYILDVSETIYVDDCVDCTFYVAPVRGSFYIRDSRRCVCSVACKQLRTKNCTDVTFFLYSVSDPHIELSFDMKFAPYNFAYPNQHADFKRVGFNVNENNWCKVYDHNSNEGDSHFSLLPPNQFKNAEKKIDGAGAPVNPVPIPQQYGGKLQVEIIPGSKSLKVPEPAIEKKKDPVSIPNPKDALGPDEQDKKNDQVAIQIYYDNNNGYELSNKDFEFPQLDREGIKNYIKQYNETSKLFYPAWYEYMLAILLVVVGFLILLLFMSLLKMSSEWKLEALGLYLTLMCVSLLGFLIFLVYQMKKIEKEWIGRVSEIANEQNSSYFEGRNSKIIATMTTLTITISS